MKLRATLQQTGKTAAGFEVAESVVDALGAGKRPPVRVTIGRHTYRSSIAPMGGSFWVGVSGKNRAAAGVAAGEELDIELELDTHPREVAVPEDFAAALDAVPEARRTFDGLSYSNRSWHVYSIEGAKTDETRQRRIAKSVDALREGRIR